MIHIDEKQLLAIKHRVYNALNQALDYSMGLSDLFGRNVRIGLVNQADKGVRHGLVHVEADDGQAVMIPFVADRPQNLINANFLTITSIFEQLVQMGFQPRYLELEYDCNHKVYKIESSRPILAETV